MQKDNTIGASYCNVLFDPVGNIVGYDVPVNTLKAKALACAIYEK